MRTLLAATSVLLSLSSPAWAQTAPPAKPETAAPTAAPAPAAMPCQGAMHCEMPGMHGDMGGKPCCDMKGADGKPCCDMAPKDGKPCSCCEMAGKDGKPCCEGMHGAMKGMHGAKDGKPCCEGMHGAMKGMHGDMPCGKDGKACDMKGMHGAMHGDMPCPHGKCGGGWPKFTLSPGLQMWRAVAATEDGNVSDPNLIGLVLKAQMTLTDMVAVHLRGAYGMNRTETPVATRDASAFMVGAGLDMYFALGRRVIWYNTMGLGFEQAKLSEDGKNHPATNNPGAYFVTTLDIGMTDSIGMWMDWGCGVVGPAFADAAAGKVNTWHINPLGAGGFRFSF